jgi:tellurite resistance protein
MNFASEIPIDALQAEAIARGLFAVARADGVHEREAALVASFWADTGGSAKALSELERREPISGEELAAALPAEPQRRLFLRSALLLALADGKVSEGERNLVHRYASVLGLEQALPDMVDEVKEFLLSHLAHLQNVEAVAQVAKELSL